jgi:hypothetical protein
MANVTLTQRYGPYGNTLTSTGTGTTAWQFAGEQRDASGTTTNWGMQRILPARPFVPSFNSLLCFTAASPPPATMNCQRIGGAD